eukprot:scaffold50979_cov61-Phaeocystis_antarctica.AAC.2
MSGALHNGEALNAHERLQPVQLLQQGLGEAAQALHHLEEEHAFVAVAAGIDDLLEGVVGQRFQHRLVRPKARQKFAGGDNSRMGSRALKLSTGGWELKNSL